MAANRSAFFYAESDDRYNRQYGLAFGKTEQDLAEKVVELATNNWNLHGSPFVVTRGSAGKIKGYYQAMKAGSM